MKKQTETKEETDKNKIETKIDIKLENKNNSNWFNIDKNESNSKMKKWFLILEKIKFCLFFGLVFLIILSFLLISKISINDWKTPYFAALSIFGIGGINIDINRNIVKENRVIAEKNKRELKEQEEKNKRELKEQEEKNKRELKEQEEKNKRELKEQEEKNKNQEILKRFNEINDDFMDKLSINNLMLNFPKVSFVSVDSNSRENLNSVFFNYLIKIFNFAKFYNFKMNCKYESKDFIFFREKEYIDKFLNYLSWKRSHGYDVKEISIFDIISNLTIDYKIKIITFGYCVNCPF